MRNILPVLIALALSSGFAASGALAAPCATGDSAICASDPNCHWDVEKRGCYEGPAPRVDACAAHGSESICQSDVSLGCAWNAETKACQTKAN